MSAKEIGIIITVALISIGGFIILAPEYRKNAELTDNLTKNKLMIDHLRTKIEHKRKIVAKLDRGDLPTISRILRERYAHCRENESIIQFKSTDLENNAPKK